MEGGEDDLLKELGVTSHAADALEREVLAQALVAAGAPRAAAGSGDEGAAGTAGAHEQQEGQQADAWQAEGGGSAPSASALRAARTRLRAVSHEMRELQGAMAMQPMQEDPPLQGSTGSPDTAGAGADGAAWGEGGDERPAAAATGGLQVLMLQQRFEGLAQERDELLERIGALEAGSSAAPDGAAASDRVGAGKAGRAQRAPAPVAQLLADDDLFGSEAEDLEGAGGGVRGGGLLESARDRAIRQGLITPFGALTGFERRAVGGGSRGPVDVDSLRPMNPFRRDPLGAEVMGAVGRAGRPLAQLMDDAGTKTRAAMASRPRAQLVAPDQLPGHLERDVRRIPSHFWQNAASGKRLPARPLKPAEGEGAGSAAAQVPAGVIPNLHATRAPLPPLKRAGSAAAAAAASKTKKQKQQNKGRKSKSRGKQVSKRQSSEEEEEVGEDDQGAGEREMAEEPGQEAGEMRAAMLYAASDRAAARRALQRLAAQASENEISSEEDEGEESNRRRSGARPVAEAALAGEKQQPASGAHAPATAAGRVTLEGFSGDVFDLTLDDDDSEQGGAGGGSPTAATAQPHALQAGNGATPACHAQLSGGPSQPRVHVRAHGGAVKGKGQRKAAAAAGDDDSGDADYVVEEGMGTSGDSSGGGSEVEEGGGGVGARSKRKRKQLKQGAGKKAAARKKVGGAHHARGSGRVGTATSSEDGGAAEDAAGEEEEEVEEEVVGAGGVGLGEEAEDLGGRWDDADDEFYAARTAAAAMRTEEEDEEAVAEVVAARLAEARAGRQAHASNSEEAKAGPEQEGQHGDRVAGGEGAVAAASPVQPAGLAAVASSAVASRAPHAGGGDAGVEVDDVSRWVEFEGGLRVPLRVWSRLFGYQRTGLQWLWELRCQRAGGILGDEMGLGKTVQVGAFLGALAASGNLPRRAPALIVCPATLMRQWLRELRRWAPELRVVVMHESFSRPPPVAAGGSGAPRPDRAGIVATVVDSPCAVLLTTYDQLRLNRDMLLPVRWAAAILDEGHKVRNPDAEVTLVAKQLRTPHRLVVSGSPIQNRLSELWSLFDFVFPGKLGTLPVFQAQFAIPIQVGGYTNATPVQVATAYRCALVLRDAVAPHLLRRRKADVRASLPRKTERVLFCALSGEALELYRAYLASGDVGEILAGGRKSLAGIDVLRKICNHPDLLERATQAGAAEYGDSSRSGKLAVASKLLAHWAAGGHKALLFCQTQQMLDICEKMVGRLGLGYHRMDGTTPLALRARLIDDFNSNPALHAFLLTTKVGGLGVNLTGADRVLLYDPDWNPATDMQARERAWRIGQSREVVVYRLITAGTIEEKVYHRQVYKSFLTNKVLRDPRQRRFFAAKDLTDLFSLGPEYSTKKKGGPGAAAGGAGLNAGAASRGAAGVLATETARLLGEGGLDAELGPGLGLVRAELGGGGRSGDDKEADDRPSVPGAAGSSKGGAEAAGDTGRKKRLSGSTVGARKRARGSDSDAGCGREEGQRGGEDDEARVLRDLFDGGGGGGRGLVGSALDHGAVERANDPEAIAAAAEAERVAAAAVDALRRCRDALRGAPVSLPTWTGRSGAAGAPAGLSSAGVTQHAAAGTSGGGGSRASSGSGGPGAVVAGGGGGRGKRFGAVTSAPRGGGAGGGTSRPPLLRHPGVSGGAASGGNGGSAGGPDASNVADLHSPPGSGVGALTSSSLLSRLRDRQHALNALAVRASDPQLQQYQTPAAGVIGDAADLLAARIVRWFEGQPGRAAGSNEVVGAFRSSVVDMGLFRQLLQQVAGLSRRNGQGVWTLKREFWGQGGAGADVGVRE